MKKKDFMVCEMEVAVTEVEATLEENEALLFVGQSSGVTNKRKSVLSGSTSQLQ